jgi:hypothetical protein
MRYDGNECVAGRRLADNSEIDALRRTNRSGFWRPRVTACRCPGDRGRDVQERPRVVVWSKSTHARIGAPADVTIMELREGAFEFPDNEELCFEEEGARDRASLNGRSPTSSRRWSNRDYFVPSLQIVGNVKEGL